MIQELTSSGLNLEGVRRVLALEAEVERLRSEVSQLREAMAKQSTELVPLRQDVVLYRKGRRE